MAADLKVVTLHESNFRDVPATLRVIAKDISDGTYTDVESVCLVMMSAEGLQIFGIGTHSDPAHCALLMQAAIHRFAREVEEYRAT